MANSNFELLTTTVKGNELLAAMQQSQRWQDWLKSPYGGLTMEWGIGTATAIGTGVGTEVGIASSDPLAHGFR